ncbi:MAG: hypothetical protein H0W34_04200 [Pyrinomonadaceae bacterium]|nr:hypothetical protein [Pyrinomonadaceae bacterium]
MIDKAPRRVVIRIQVVDDRTTALLKSLSPGPTYDQIVLRSARQFFSEVSLPPP